MEPVSENGATNGYGSATIAHLWEHPNLCVAIFGVQFHTQDGQERYGASGIPQEMDAALEEAKAVGFLHQERLMAEDGGVLLQYWRSYEDLDQWARTLPHMAWWRWLLDNAGADVSFYHEVYQVKTAEAIYERGCRLVGAALIAGTSAVEPGGNQSRQRQERFAEAAAGANGKHTD